MKYPNSLVLGQTTRVWLQTDGVRNYPENYWFIQIGVESYDSDNPGGYSVTFVTNLLRIFDGRPFDGIVVDVYLPPNAIYIGGANVGYSHNSPPPPTPGYTNFYESVFNISCMNVSVTATKESPLGAAVPATSPQQYLHRYRVSAETLGGTRPFTYSWSTTVGTLTDYSPSGDSCILEVVTTTQNFSGITGTLSCTVADSGSCSASDSANVQDATDPTTQCVPPTPDPAIPQCSCQANICQAQPFGGCKMGDGSNIVGPGNPDAHSIYGGSRGGGGSRPGSGSPRPGGGVAW